jgi:histidinol dehydrogenase
MFRTLLLPRDGEAFDQLIRRLRLDAADLALLRGERADIARAVAATIADVAERGDAALVDQARRFDDPGFSAGQLRVTPEEMKAGHGRIGSELREALRRAIRQVGEYQRHILPKDPAVFERPGFAAQYRYTPLDSAGLYFPGGKASYPSSLIMLAVPAQVAGVKRVVACTPPSRHFSDAVLAVGYELGLTEMYRVGGVAAIAAMAVGTETIAPVDKIAGPGNLYVQMAKRAVSGAVGVDGFFGPSEIVVIADESADAATVAADLLAQAEHDPGSCFLLTTSQKVVDGVAREVESQVKVLPRKAAVERSLLEYSVAVLCDSEEAVYATANRLAAEHVSLRVADLAGASSRLRHGGCVFAGEFSPVAAGDYLAGPSHCLPTNTTARFASGISVHEFLKRSSVVTYTRAGIASDSPHIAEIARAEGLEAHARSAEMRVATAKRSGQV